MQPDLRALVERALGSSIRAAQAAAGGDINEAWSVELASGQRVFVKANPGAEPAMFETEAHGLAWLREVDALRVPGVLAVSRETPAFLVLEHLGNGRPRADFDAALGRGLASLHRAGAACFGLEIDNYIGRLPQANRARETWADFYREQRLEPMVERARRAGLLSRAMLADFERLYARLPDLVGPAEPPSRLHGDLWGGNCHVAADGAPCLIDPAVYGGHREIDLAMMRLFGGFSGEVFGAYREAWPLAPGYEERVDLYQLYPLLVHVNLFGGSYVGSVQRALSRYI